MAKKRKGAEKTREEIQPKNGETPVQVAAPSTAAASTASADRLPSTSP